MSLNYINNSLSHMLTRMVENSNQILSNENLIISIEDNPSVMIIKEKDKIIKKLYHHNNKLLSIIDIYQKQLIDNNTKITDLEHSLTDKNKLVQNLTNQIMYNQNTKINNKCEDVYCLGCSENPRTNLFIPCYHLTYCDNCIIESSKHSNKCPICRVIFNDIKKIYY